MTFGLVDPFAPGVAEGISRLLLASISDARSEVGGHLPTWLVRDIERNYLVPEKVQTVWAPAGHRFAARIGERIVGTVHVAQRHAIILSVNRDHNVVPAAQHPGLKPARQHQVVNISVLHELRHLGLARQMFDAIATDFRGLFDGDGLWVRADPPWHAWLVRLGFTHDPTFDVFLPAEVERTADLPHAAFNLLHACACEGSRSPDRARAMETSKLQYVSFTRPFGALPTSTKPPAAASHAPTSADGLATSYAAATQTGHRVAVSGSRSGPALTPADLTLSTRALDRVVALADDHVVVGAGLTWRSLLAALPPGRLPPVVPGYVDATIGGSLSTGGIGKGSAMRGLAIDHVRALDVVTRDGRRVSCSRESSAWLFEAMLGGQGLFGAIVEATLSLEPRRRWLSIERIPAGIDAIATALDVDAYHAFGTWTDGGFLAITARESDAETGTSLASFVTPRSRPVIGMAQAFFDARGLDAFLRDVSSSKGLDGLAVEGGAVTIHPIRRNAARASLLFPRVDANVTYAFTVAAPRDPRVLRERARAHGALVSPRWPDVH